MQVQLVVIDTHSEVPLHYHNKMTGGFHIIAGTGSMNVG
jgi:quercetin dioxygenase-like cupin family protein